MALGNASYRGKLKGGTNMLSKGFYSGAYSLFYMVFNKEMKERYEFKCWNIKDKKEVFNFWD